MGAVEELNRYSSEGKDASWRIGKRILTAHALRLLFQKLLEGELVLRLEHSMRLMLEPYKCAIQSWKVVV